MLPLSLKMKEKDLIKSKQTEYEEVQTLLSESFF